MYDTIRPERSRRHFGREIRMLCALALCLSMIFVFFCTSGITFAEDKITEKDIEQLQEKTKELEKALKQQKELLSEMQHNEETLQLALGTYSALAKQYYERIEENEKAQAACSASLEKFTEDEAALKSRKAELYENYLMTLRALREDRTTSPLEMVFDAENLEEFLSAFERAKDLAGYKSKVLEKIDEEFEEVEQEEIRIRAQLNEQITLGEELRRIRDEVESQIAQTEKHLTEIAQDILSTKSNIMEYEDISRETLAELSDLIKAYEKQLEEERKRREEEQRRKEEEEERKRLARQSLLWPLDYPLNRRCTSPYGYRIHPISGTYKFHSGVDLAGPSSGVIMNDPIYASMDGTVITCVVDRGTTGYGTYVIISHGYNERYGGYISTLYAHCDALYVKLGDHVTQGQVIGEVGTTGSSTGPHLHYEVRKGGDTTDPFSYTYVTKINGTPVDPKTFLTGTY